MRLIDRYLLRELLVPLGYCLGGFLIFYVAFDLIASLNRYQEHQLSVRDVVELYAVKTPEILSSILPVALLLALLYALTNHSRHNELTALRAAGISLWRICASYFALGLALSGVVLMLNEYWVPDSVDKQDAIMEHRTTPGAYGSLGNHANLMFSNAREHRKWVIGLYDFNTDTIQSTHVYWRENGVSWHIVAPHGEYYNGMWTFYGQMAFITNDVVDLKSLTQKLLHPDNNITIYLGSQLSKETQDLLAKYPAQQPLLLAHLVDDFNHIVRQSTLYDTRRFAAVKISPEAANLIAQKPQDSQMAALNCILLADVFPAELSRNSICSVIVYRGDTHNGFELVPFLNTNMLTMPEFTENPREFANEARFSDRFRNKMGTEDIEAPILDIMDYLKAHPDLNPEYRRSLETQMHSRIASPWTCLVVVMIAIPFGAVSGRRNIFAGVAGSIVICFVYFIMLKLSLALGTGGYVPGWVAAWLPNVCFGLLGAVLLQKVQ
jgi:lipopolysaccharide export LptBFGC system permease protein LptF